MQAIIDTRLDTRKIVTEKIVTRELRAKHPLVVVHEINDGYYVFTTKIQNDFSVHIVETATTINVVHIQRHKQLVLSSNHRFISKEFCSGIGKKVTVLIEEGVFRRVIKTYLPASANVLSEVRKL